MSIENVKAEKGQTHAPEINYSSTIDISDKLKSMPNG